MKAVILAGGLGTRISEESDSRPKPMVEIGGRPILWHIMKMYANHGVNDFIICLGYKGHLIKEYFYNYYRYSSDFKISLRTGHYEILNSDSEDWKVTFIDTGLHTQTGGRIKRIENFVENETFCVTYGDGVSDINISHEIDFHKKSGKMATLAAVKPPGRFASLDINPDGTVMRFREKPSDEMGWINGGFFVLEPQIFSYIKDDSTIWERQPLEDLTNDGQLAAYFHHGFWQPMDTLREMRLLRDLFEQGSPPWLLKN